ncbi:M15 family metallopeptidase [Rhizobium leguminosarum]|uniref:M15 family metallopeptidase n=1 Tax=Rhizobium leguminosarum TaxID=384 RepID=UPI0015DA929A|nr:M15 family metallopeptidase [Rhizobium leguminosarum]NZD50544.1 M15 family metallopeptidase [Rhizobium leguminosarum]
MADNDNNLVFTVSSDMSAAQRGLAKFSNDVGAATDQIAKKYQAAGTKIDASTTALQNRINGMVGLGAKASKEWTGALADQGKELERLRARYSPLFATINQYKTAVADIKRAHAIGAISADEMATAISKERQAALASTAAIKGRNAALAAAPAQRQNAGGGFQTANIAAQFQDIAVSLQGGSKPLTVALQQGTQLSSVLATMGSGKQIIAGLGAAFASLVSPVSLVTIGLIAAGGAAYQYFTSVGDGGKKSEDALKKEAELIQSVADKWGGVLPELKKYADERQKLIDQKEQKDASIAAADNQWTELRKTIGNTTAAYAEFLQTFNDQAADTAKVGALQKAYKELSDGIANGTATSEQAKTVQEALLALMQDTGIKAVGDFAKTFDGLATSIAGARSEADKLKSTPLFNENAPKSQLPVLGTVGPVYSDNGKLLTDPNEIDRYNKQQQDNRNPTIDTGRGLPVPVPTPTTKPIQLGEEPNKQAETAATKAANAYRDLLKAADDRIQQLQQETNLLGKYGVEADAARFALDLFQQSEDKGRSLSDAQRKEIEKKVALYKQYSETLSKAKLQQDLLMDMRFNSLSKQDQQVTTTLRQYGLPEDLNSQEAGQIRSSLRTGELRDDLHSFASDFKNALLNNGGDFGKAFADAIQNAALNQISKIADRFIEQIINGIIGSVSGQPGAATGGIGGAISTALTGAVSGKAPVTAVTRAPLAAIPAGSTKTGIDLAQVSTSSGLVANVNKQFAANFQGLIDGLEGVGYKIKSLGGYNFRNIAGTNKLSNHAFGDAIDINPGANPMGRRLVTDMPSSVSSLAAQNGLLWGGDWNSKKDAMHFEVQSSKTAADALNKLAGSTGDATQGLGQLGNGLSQFGSGLGSMGGGGGGGFDWASLFSPSFKPNTTFGAFLGLADGGHVTGPGGPTSDSVPAMLSNGEFVVNAASTRRHRRLLDAINSGTVAHLAKGGIVAPALSPSGRGYGGDNVEIKIINNTSSQISQTKRKTASGQTIEMVIDDVVADKMTTPGSRSRGAVQSQFGLQSGLARR